MYPDNLNNPYGENLDEYQLAMSQTRFKAPESNSTMVSDSVEMTRRLKRFVPATNSHAGKARSMALMSDEMKEEENNEGDNYKSAFR